MQSTVDTLFSPIRIGTIELRNRVVAPPMVQLRPIASPAGIAWYRRLAAGGAALVIVEATGVPHFGKDLTTDALIPLVDAIHAEGAAAAIQLLPIPFGGKRSVDELTTGDVRAIVDHYARASRICRDAGFDGVEPHGAHGYLLNQFFMSDKNRRQDEYGGLFENRCRLAVDIVAAIRHAAGDGLLILYRHTPTGEAYTLDDSLVLAERLVEAGVDVLDISPARGNVVAELAQPFKARLSVPIIAVGGMSDPVAAAEAITTERCDLVAIGRQLIADTEWPTKMAAGLEADIIRCKGCDVGCFGNLKEGKHVECVLWSDEELAAYHG